MKINQVKKSVCIFIVGIILIGWIGKIIDMIVANQNEGNSIGMLVWIVGPIVMVFAIKLALKDCGKNLGLKLNLKSSLLMYLAAVVIFPVIFFAVFLIGKASGLIITASVIVSNISDNKFIIMLAAFGFSFIIFFVKNIFEEIAWRGFLNERLILMNVKDVVVYIVVTLVWATWHIPYYLFFLKVDNPWQTALTNYIVLFSWVMMFTEMYRISRSIWPCVILHAFANSIALLCDYVTVQEGFEWILSYNCGLIQIIICIMAGLLLRRYRIKNDTIQNNEEIYGDTINELI